MNAKLKPRVKVPRTKPTTYVSLTGGYTPAEEKAMQEHKVALIEKQEAYLRSSNQHLATIENGIIDVKVELVSMVLAITALSNVLQVLVAQAVPAKRGRPAKEKTPEGTQEPAGATPAVEPKPDIDTTVTHSLAAAQEFAAKQVKPPAPEGLVHESIKTDAKPHVAPTLDELRTLFLDFIAKNGREEGIKKLQSFGITKLGELPANEYGAFKSLLA